MSRKRYAAFAMHSRPCAECDEDENGPHNRHDHGCCVDVQLCETDSLAAARMVAGKHAKATSEPVSVEDRDEGTVWSL